MFNQYFYHEHTRRAVTVFGTLFNNIYVVKRDFQGNSISKTKVPLSYGPRQKFLARINDEQYLNDPKLAIKLPRMAFEIVSMTIDSNTKLQRTTSKTIPSASGTSKTTVFHPITYRLGFQLNILAKSQDDALQILEQILPYFQPEYTVTVKQVEDNFKADMPFVLQGVVLSDDYEGDFLTRRAITYTLDFETRVRYYGHINRDQAIIKSTKTNIADINMSISGEPYLSQTLSISPISAGVDDEYEIVASYSPKIPPRVKLFFTSKDGDFSIGDSVVSNTSVTAGRIIEIGDDYIIVDAPDGNFILDEIVFNSDQSNFVITNIETIWNTVS